MVFTATTNNTGENGDKKQNTLPYTLQVKVVEVCLVGAGDESRTRREQLGNFTFQYIFWLFWAFYLFFMQNTPIFNLFMQILFKISTLKMAEILDGGKMAENFTPFGGFFFAYLSNYSRLFSKKNLINFLWHFEI